MAKAKPESHKSSSVREAAAAYGLPGGEIVLYSAPDGTVSLDVCR
jgi:hypothetical protein